ncbi:MAG: hypothetical protein A4S14_05100 [Proteobacteria bacterium SG_bin9]|nr:MAG: hypothetical protein A4S14_05100 [Proteobacteria bacterium SG_bin9]
MTQVYFHCSNVSEILVDRCGAEVNDLTEARDQAVAAVRSVAMARNLLDWRSWKLHVSDELGDELFIVPFAFVLGNPRRIDGFYEELQSGF